jgi:hypothetical protein
MWDVGFAVALVIGSIWTAFEAGKIRGEGVGFNRGFSRCSAFNDGDTPSGLEARSSAQATMADDGDTPSGAEVRR